SMPFAGDAQEMAFGKVARPVPSLLSRAPHVPVRLAAIVERLLERDPRARIGSAAEALQMLDEAAAARVVVAAPALVAPRVVELAPTDRVEPVRRARFGRSAALAAALIAGTVTGAVIENVRNDARPSAAALAIS